MAAKKKAAGLVVVHQQTTRRLGDLEPASYNANEMSREEFEALKLSIKTFGFVEPVVVGEEGPIIGGHQRVAALRELGAPPDFAVPVIVVSGLTDSRTRALNLALNRIRGEINWAKLGDMVTAISDGDLPLTGFTQDELEELGRLMADPARTPLNAATLDQQLGALARRFKFEVASDDEQALCMMVLKRFGMTGPGNASAAFVAAMRAALKAKPAKAAA